MRIVSKFRDYYDSVAYSMGYDESFTFVRSTDDFQLSNKRFNQNPKIRYVDNYRDFNYDDGKGKIETNRKSV